MKKLILIFALAMFVVACGEEAQVCVVPKRDAPVRQGWPKYMGALYGDVESVTEEVRYYNEMPVGDTEVKPSTAEVYKFNDRGDLVEKRNEDFVDNRSWRVIYSYNADGRMELEECFVGDELSWSSRYKYDAAGRVVEKLSNNTHDYDTKDLYAYDEYGNNTETKFYKEGEFINRSTKKYDEAGRMIESAFYDKNDSLIEQRFLAYNGNGDLTEELVLRYPSTTYSYRHSYERDRRGNVVKIVHYNEKDEVTSYATSNYDDEGNRLEYISYKGDNLIDSRFTSKYDAHGNLIESAYYQGGNENPRYVKSYTIVYRTEAAE
jgi:hypothetical protein